MVSLVPDRLTEESVGHSLRKWKILMLNEVEMAQELLCPLCPLRFAPLSVWFGILCRDPVLNWKRIRTRRGNVREGPQLAKKINRVLRLIQNQLLVRCTNYT